MESTVDDGLLARAEARTRSRAMRRRLVVLLPSVGVVLWALTNLLAARRAHLVAADAGAFRRIVDPVLPVLWTLLFVLLPLTAALKPQPMPIGAVCAWLAGPVVTPMLFGPGGWHAWQIAALTLVLVLVIGAARERARGFPA